MKNVFYILIFLSFASFSSAKAESPLNARCKSVVKNPHVSVTASYEPLTYDHTKVGRTLTRLHSSEYGGNVHEGYQITGLATYDLGTELNFNLSKQKLQDGVVCFYPSDIKLDISMRNPTIYIARSIKKGTCAYEVALRHEQTHQQINLEVIEKYVPIIKNRFVEAVKKYAIASREKDDVSMEIIQEGLQKKYLEAINPVLEEIKTEIKTEQEKLDNIEHYNYEQSLCQ